LDQKNDQVRAMVEAYDEEAEATGWFGPEVSFGLVYKYIQPGQSILDIGIGTGLGSTLFREAGLKVYGMDVSSDMLDACRSKGFTDLTQHDLTILPYPYSSESLDHVICVGVLNFFSDLSPVFKESARILRKEGLFVFVVGDRNEEEAMEVVVGVEHTKSDTPMTMYYHSAKQIERWVIENGFTPLRNLEFKVYMDNERIQSIRAKAYLLKKATGTETGSS
jgi:predicted TPR repeat methyltransferase